MLQTSCVRPSPQVRRHCPAWFYRSQTQATKWRAKCPPPATGPCSASKQGWGQTGRRKPSVIHSRTCPPPQCSPPQRALCKRDLKPYSLCSERPQKTCLEPSFGEGSFASFVDFHFYKSHLSLLAQTLKNSSPTSKPVLFFFFKCTAPK